MGSIRITLTVWVVARLGRLSYQGTREADDSVPRYYTVHQQPEVRHDQGEPSGLPYVSR